MTQHNQQNSPLVSVYLRRAGELHFLQVHLSAVNHVFSDVDQLASLLEGERTKVTTVSKGKVSDVPDAFRNKHFLESTVFETAVSDDLQLWVWLENNLAQLSTVGEGILSELSDSAGNEHLFYVATDEPIISYDLEPVREAQHLRVLVQAKLLSCHPYVRRNA